MAGHRRTTAAQVRPQRFLLLVFSVSLGTAGVAAAPSGAGVPARAQTHATVGTHTSVRTHATARTRARAQARAAAPQVIFQEDFENHVSTTPVPLLNYTSATNNETYTADPAWLRNCNGIIINATMSSATTAEPPQCNRALNGVGTPVAPHNYGATGMQSLVALAEALGVFHGLPPTNGNSALAAYTDTGVPQAVDPGCVNPPLAERQSPNQVASATGNNDNPALWGAYLPTTDPPGACTQGRVQFQTNQPIPLPADAGGHPISLSVDVATINCPGSLLPPYNTAPGFYTFTPLLQFRVVNPANPADVRNFGPQIDACTNPGLRNETVTVPLPLPVRRNGTASNTPDPTWNIAARVGTYQASAMLPAGWTSFGLQLINNQANGAGNDSAIDNIQVLSEIPQVSKSFSPSLVTAGQPTTLTFTISNTTNLLAQPAWSFTDTLPSGMTVASPASPSITCGGQTVTVTAPSGASPPGTITPGADSIHVEGSGLAAGQETCTVSINVTAAVAGAYTNTQDNIGPYPGLFRPPQHADVTFEPGTLCFTLAPATATLGTVTPGGTAQGYLGTVRVTDARGLASAAEWTVTVTSTDFTTGPSPAGTIPASDATYTAGTVDTTGTITVAGHTPLELSNSPGTVLTATQGSGVNTASWDPWTSVSVPAGAVIGTYTATITHSVF